MHAHGGTQGNSGGTQGTHEFPSENSGELMPLMLGE